MKEVRSVFPHPSTNRTANLPLPAALSVATSHQDAGLSERLSAVYAQLQASDADRAPARAAVILRGLGFTPAMQKRPTKEFSGGWRMRLALARALFSQ